MTKTRWGRRSTLQPHHRRKFVSGRLANELRAKAVSRSKVNSATVFRNRHPAVESYSPASDAPRVLTQPRPDADIRPLFIERLARAGMQMLSYAKIRNQPCKGKWELFEFTMASLA